MLNAGLEEAAAEQSAANAAMGRRTTALGRVLAAAEAAPETMLELDVPRVASASVARRSSVAFRALAAEVACALGVGEESASTLLSDAEVLTQRATATLAELCAGRISYRHAAVLVEAMTDLPAHAVAEVEAAVLHRAPEVTAAKFGSLARNARNLLHPIPAEVRHEAAKLKANVWVDDGKDGMSWLTALLPTAAAYAAYDRITRTATKAKNAGDPRGVGQLRAATLTALLLDDTAGTEAGADRVPEQEAGESGTTAATETPPPGAALDSLPATAPPGSPPPELANTAPPDDPRSSPPPTSPSTSPPNAPPDPLATLARSVRPVVHVTVPVSTLTGTGEDPATLDGVTPLDPETARQLAALAPTLRRILTEPVTGAMLTVDRRSYVVPADLRAFLTQRDVTCRFPGCRIPAARCDVDHTIAWADGGGTDAENLAHLCRRHHTLKHESRWAVEQLDAGVLAWTSPRGRTYLTTPGSADHTLATLDQWTAEARSLVRETAPGATTDPVADHGTVATDGADPADGTTRTTFADDITPPDTTQADALGDPPF
ncbi:hypothetical protein GCM10009809_01380 [Isoptericola hypogeus]|uniref:HNH nuclease domain-containing protein n=1 Tax=Isoptericola hypogeus TaxID=300179 RepID=A0ABP4URP4_9MICO